MQLTERNEELCRPWHLSCVSEERAGSFVGRRKLDTVLLLLNAMQFNAMKTKFHYRGSAFEASILYGSQVKKT